MIEIISRPNMKKCKNCGCEFTYEDEDIKSENISQTVDSPFLGYKSFYVTCPQCSSKVILNQTRQIIYD